MFIAALCDGDGACRTFGPFKTNFAARDWAMECQSLGFFPHATFTTYEIEEPYDLGFDTGL